MAEIVIYKAKDGHIELNVSLSDETVWLSLQQIADLFARDKSTVSRHLNNIFKNKELAKGSVVANFATTAADGKTYQVDYYNLDAIISLGYRVNSKEGIKFRQWATSVLKEHLIKGYTTYEQRLAERAAHLLYFIIKDHPFTDGNKRIACLMFLLYLKLQNINIKLNENGLVALALLVAESAPSQKDMMIRLTVNLLMN